MGGRKLYHELGDTMNRLNISRGRDAFFTLLRERDLLVPVKRSRRTTTRSGLWRCPNRLIGLEINHINQAWVADITYIATERRFFYLALVTDIFSRCIVGYDLSSSLAAEGALRALNMAIGQTLPGHLKGLIHHSDHGIQYICGLYSDRLQLVDAQSSMGEVGNCYENALAERVIGILKCEYGLDDLFVNGEQAHRAVSEAVYLYCHERPHTAIGYAKPAEIYFNN